jgi:hypothetical protein
MRTDEPMYWNQALAPLVLALLGALVARPAHAADFFVAPDGNDSNAGTLERPFATVERAERAASAGDTVYLRGGVYRFSGTSATVGVAFTKSGTSGKPIRYFGYQDEVPIFDLFELKPQARVTGLDLRCDWIHLRGLEVRGVRQLIVGDSWSVRVRGSNNVLERLNVHDGQAPGVFISSGASNLVLNCDSHHNYDPLEQGGNADGFGCHSTGGDNVLRGCRAYENSDDGFDFINAPGTCTVESSWAFRNGFIPDTNMAGANGAGFKSGGFGEPPNVPATGVPRHVVRNNVAFGNRAIGVYANHHPGGIDFFNNTAFDNPANFDMRPPASGSTTMHKLRNNLSAGTGRAIVNFNGGSDSVNSWTLPVMVMSADFASMDKALALAPRRPDGSLPENGLMRLAAGSDLIDRGENVGLPFAGKAPDLGAFELGAVTPGGGADAGVDDAAARPVPDAATATDAAGPVIDGATGPQDAATPRADAGAGAPSPASDAGQGSSVPGARVDAASPNPTGRDAGAASDAAVVGPGWPDGERSGAEGDGGCAVAARTRGVSAGSAGLLALCLVGLASRRRRA